MKPKRPQPLYVGGGHCLGVVFEKKRNQDCLLKIFANCTHQEEYSLLPSAPGYKEHRTPTNVLLQRDSSSITPACGYYNIQRTHSTRSNYVLLANKGFLHLNHLDLVLLPNKRGKSLKVASSHTHQQNCKNKWKFSFTKNNFFVLCSLILCLAIGARSRQLFVYGSPCSTVFCQFSDTEI